MLKEVRILSIFVASPGDVLEERDAVDAIVSDLNTNLCPALGVRLDVLRWEKNVAPGFGEDAQDVINQQIGDEYDIFVGILANRFGTPTKLAESGTAEEFERAYARFKEDPESVHLMIYFNDGPVNPSTLDLDQVGNVRRFRESLGPKGGLYRAYDGAENFKELFRNHLTRIVVGLGDKEALAVAEEKPKNAEPINSELDNASVPVQEATIDDLMNLEELDLSDAAGDYGEEDFGVLDYIDIYSNEFVNLNEAIDELVELNKKFSEQLGKRTAEINRINAIKDDRLKIRELRKAFLVTSRLFDIYSEITERDTTKLADARTKAFGAIAEAVAIYASDPNLNGAEFGELSGQLAQYELAAGGAGASMAGMKETIDGLPRFSGAIATSQIRLSNALGRLLLEMEAQKSSATDLRISIDKLVI